MKISAELQLPVPSEENRVVFVNICEDRNVKGSNGEISDWAQEKSAYK